MIFKIFIFLALIIAGFFIYVAMKPSKMFISRQMVIKASPEVLFRYINNPEKSNEWMPWSDEDPDVMTIYSGPAEGLGATSSWSSTGKMGVGKAEVVESLPNQRVKTQLTYTKPMTMSQLAEVSLDPTSDGTLVRWSVTGENDFVSRLFCTFIDMDKVVGEQFVKGLNKLKNLTEGKL